MLKDFPFFIKQLALTHHFALCGVARANTVSSAATDMLKQWSGSIYRADMDWFERNKELRNDPSLLLDNAKTIVMLGYPYTPIAANFTTPLEDRYYTASYTHATDYHYTLKAKMELMASEIKKQYGELIDIRYFTDSAPFMERYWAVEAGLGWIGRSGMLVNRQHGSFILLAEMVINKESDSYDKPDSFNGCGSCQKCIVNCPTQAIRDDKTIDARRCVSYLTIEHKGDFSEQQTEIISNATSKRHWICGCDSCLGVCPYNQENIAEAVSMASEQNHEYGMAINLSLSELNDMSGGAFKRHYGSTPLARPGLKQLIRNMTITKIRP